MKRIKLVAASALFLAVISGTTSCKKDSVAAETDQFTEIQSASIVSQESAMSDAEVEATTEEGIQWKKGDIYVYKTKLGAYGKFQIDSIDASDNYKLTLRAVTYNSDGTVAKQASALEIHGTWSCDLDNLEEVSDVPVTDFFWSRNTETVTYFSPYNGAKFVKYTF